MVHLSHLCNHNIQQHLHRLHTSSQYTHRQCPPCQVLLSHPVQRYLLCHPYCHHRSSQLHLRLFSHLLQHHYRLYLQQLLFSNVLHQLHHPFPSQRPLILTDGLLQLLAPHCSRPFPHCHSFKSPVMKVYHAQTLHVLTRLRKSTTGLTMELF